jgi:phosphoenolpyruvate carboxykinase (GTP)
VGDDIAWMKFGNDERLYAINPEAGFFGVAPGTSWDTNPNAMKTIAANTIFTNTALTPEGDVWWEGLTPQPPEKLTDWQGQAWTPADGKAARKAAHPNARFTVAAAQCPTIDPRWEDPLGVPISAVLFGGRRADTVPLVYEAYNWSHGAFIGSAMASETTAAAVGEVGRVRRDPFAMLPFCGYNMADFFENWLRLQRLSGTSQLPRIYAVNWFRRDENGEFLWPGFGDNSRVLKWIFRRVAGRGKAKKTVAGLIPAPGEIDISGLDIAAETLEKLFAVNAADWRAEAHGILDFYEIFGSRLPAELHDELEELMCRLTPKLEMV